MQLVHPAPSASVLLALVLACSGVVVVDGGGEGGDGTASSGSAGQGAAGAGCVPCGGRIFEAPDGKKLSPCPGKEQDDYEALLACACTEQALCLEDCVDVHDDLLCEGGFVLTRSLCWACVKLRCPQEFAECTNSIDP